MISYPFGSNKLKNQSLKDNHRSRTVAVKFAKAVFTVCFSICLLLGLMRDAMSRAEVPGTTVRHIYRSVTGKPDKQTESPGPDDGYIWYRGKCEYLCSASPNAEPVPTWEQFQGRSNRNLS